MSRTYIEATDGSHPSTTGEFSHPSFYLHLSFTSIPPSPFNASCYEGEEPASSYVRTQLSLRITGRSSKHREIYRLFYGNIYGTYLKSIKETQRITTCKWLDFDRLCSTSCFGILGQSSFFSFFSFGFFVCWVCHS
jgi:hypothetical protein